MAGLRIFFGSGAGPLAANFALNSLVPFGHSLRHGTAQIKITAQTFAALANKGEHRFRVLDIDRVSQFACPDETVRLEIAQVNFQRFQLRKFFRQTGGLIGTLDLTQAVFRPRIGFPRRHHFDKFGPRGEGGLRSARKKLVKVE